MVMRVVLFEIGGYAVHSYGFGRFMLEYLRGDSPRYAINRILYIRSKAEAG
jgi:prolipoprotein diacylglyceryltransferase